MLIFLGEKAILEQNLAYFVAYTAYGMYFVCLGPLVPYLAEESGRIQTDYSFLFICRSSGMILGSFLFNYYESFQNRPTLHTVLAFACANIIIANYMFLCSSTFFFQGLWIFLTSINFFLIEVSMDICTIMGKNIDQILLLESACHGFGSALGPFLLRLMGKDSYLIFALILGSTIPFFAILPSPEQTVRQCKIQTQRKTINKVVQNLLSFTYAIYIGMLVIKISWSSMYAVMSDFSTKQEATIFPSLYQFFNISCKFIWVLMPLKASQKFIYSTSILILVSITSLLLVQLGYPQQAIFFDCISMGIFMSPISSLVFSVNSQFDKPLTEKQASKISMWGVIGQGTLTLVYVKLMKFVGINIYFYLSIAIWICMRVTVHFILLGLRDVQNQALLDVQLICKQGQLQRPALM